MHNDKIIGIAWFDETQWQLLTYVVPDRSELDDTFQEWERSAQSTVRMIEAQGHAVRRVPVNINELCSWCAARKLPVNSAARAEYVAALLQHGDTGC